MNADRPGNWPVCFCAKSEASIAGFSGTGEGVLMAAVDKMAELMREYYAQQAEEQGGGVS